MIAGLVILAASGVFLLVASAADAWHGAAVVSLSATDHRRGWSRVHGDLDPTANRLVEGWLTAIYRLAAPLSRARVRPDALSLLGVWLTAWALPAAAAGGRWPLLGALAVTLAGIADGLDGAVAVIAGRATPHGAVLDAVADRICDGVLLCGVWLLGAPAWLALAAGAAVVALEVTRLGGIRLVGGAGGRITPGERPTRLILCGLGFVAAGLFVGDATAAATMAAAAILAICGLSWLWLLVDLRNR
jgi:phosphatidylglycerophosphate synthase